MTSGLQFGFMACMCLLGMGNALQCYSYKCTNYSNPIMPSQCSQIKPVTCGKAITGTPADRCMTQRIEMKIDNGGQVMIMSQETRNCTSSLMCDEDLTCKTANTSSGGKFTKCELGCCKGDLCNTGAIPTPGPKPTGPSGADLSCYTCGSGTMNISHPMLPTNDCKNPSKMTCGSAADGMLQDRCVRAILMDGEKEFEYRNCSNNYFCNENAICAILKQSGMSLSSCKISCCYGSLCNSGPTSAPMTTAPGPGPGPTSSSSIAAAFTSTMTYLLVMFASLLAIKS